MEGSGPNIGSAEFSATSAKDLNTLHGSARLGRNVPARQRRTTRASTAMGGGGGGGGGGTLPLPPPPNVPASPQTFQLPPKRFCGMIFFLNSPNAPTLFL